MQANNWLLSCFFLFMGFISGYSQDIDRHQWENRIVVILASDKDNPLIERQLTIFKSDIPGWKERKLVGYISTFSFYKRFDANEWQKANQKIIDNGRELKKEDAAFEVILIGLDGGIKLRSSSLVTNAKLYELIDRMPMRRSELRKKN